MNPYILIVLVFFLLVIAVVILYFLLRPKRDKVATAEARPGQMRGWSMEDDEEMEEALSRRIFTCPNCDTEVGPYDEECPSCGAHLKVGEFECPNCGQNVDPRDRECPVCGEILTPEPYVCPNCYSVVEPDTRRCDRCGTSFWSPIQLDENTLKKKRREYIREEDEEGKEEEKREERDIRDKYRSRLSR